VVRSLGKLAHRIAITLGAFRVDLHGLVEIRIEGSDQDAFLGLDQMDGVALTQVIAFEHGLRDGRTGRVADGSDRGLFGHVRVPGGEGYNKSNNILASEQRYGSRFGSAVREEGE
jgi:hypothetical protein